MFHLRTLSPRFQSLRSQLSQDQMQDLQEYIEQLEDNDSINRESLYDVILSVIDGSSESAGYIKQLIYENRRLSEKIQEGYQERTTAHSKALLNAQILDSKEEERAQLVMEYEENVNEDQYQLDKRIRVWDAMNDQYLELVDQVDLIRKSKNMNIVGLSKETLLAHDRVQSSTEQLKLFAKEIHRFDSHSQHLDQQAQGLHLELVKAKMLAKNPVRKKFLSPKHSLNNSFEGFNFKGQLSDSSEDDQPIVIDNICMTLSPKSQSKLAFFPQFDVSKQNVTLNRSHDNMPGNAWKREVDMKKKIAKTKRTRDKLEKQLEALTEEIVQFRNENTDLLQQNAQLHARAENSYNKQHQAISKAVKFNIQSAKVSLNNSIEED